MRYTVPITLTKANQNSNDPLFIPVDNYVGPLLRAIKIGLQKTNYGFYEKMYANGHKVKNFAMAVNFPKATYQNKKIYPANMRGNMRIHFSTNDPQTTLGYFNAFQQMRVAHHMNLNEEVRFTVGTPIVEHEKTATHDAIIVKAMSPIVLTDGPRGKYINYANLNPNEYTADNEAYTASLRASIKNHLTKPELIPYVNSLQILPVKTRGTVLSLFGSYISATTGQFALQGHPKLLNELLQNGIGSKRGCFCGMLKLIEEI